MKTPPQSFLIFQEELLKAKAEKAKLKAHYNEKIEELNHELSFLKEQVSSQRLMLEQSLEYASKLEGQISRLNESWESDQENSNRSYH